MEAPEISSILKGKESRINWHAAAWAALCVIGALLFAESFRRWGHPTIDLGRDLYLPSQILQGRVLYRDLMYNYGPTIPYLLAGITAIAGDSLLVFEVVGFTIGLSTMIALYAIGFRLGGYACAFFSALLFLVFSFFANSTWGCNFVLPYSYSATLGTAAALWSYYFLHRYLYDDRSAAALGWSVFFLIVTLFSKHEIGLAIGLVHALAWWTHRVPLKIVVGIMGTCLVLGLMFLAAFAAKEPGDHALLSENLLRYSGNVTDIFFHKVAGLDALSENIMLTVRSSLQVAGIIALACLAGLTIPKLRQKKWAPRAMGAGGIVAALACAWLIYRFADVRQFQASLPFAILLFVFLAIRDRRDPLLLLSVFVLLSALRVPMKFYPVWFGFYLFAPAFPLLACALGPRLARRIPGGRFAAFALAALAIVIMLRFHQTTAKSFARMTSTLTTSKGTMNDFPIGRAEAIEGFLAYVESRFPDERPSMVVFPDGIGLNYFADMSNPTAYYLFIPAEVNSPELEARIIGELETARPDYVAFTSRYMKEFGVKGFGIDYGLDVSEWIERTYVNERVFTGPEGTSWRILLMRRRDA
jgi:hypothetical protein